MITPHLQRSRVLKALTDRPREALDFDTSERRLAAIRVAIVLGGNQHASFAGQACALTAVATARKCFGSVVLVARPETKLRKELYVGDTIGGAARALGATVVDCIPSGMTHVIAIDADSDAGARAFVRCWWDGWLAGVVPQWDTRSTGASQNPLAGAFAGALAVREVFATVLGQSRAGLRSSVISVWEPWVAVESASAGPPNIYMPSRLWLIGLGHLGQGILWNLLFIPAAGRDAVLQDDQTVGEENEATGLLTTIGDLTRRKTRVAAPWLEKAGWPTRLIERRHYGDVPLVKDDPLIVITALDDPDPRKKIAKGQFEYMLDAGVGHGATDFEGLQIRVVKKGADVEALWSAPEKPKDRDLLLENDAYKQYIAMFDKCGAVTIADGSVAVPFVGAAVGALLVAQWSRLAGLVETPQIMQMELGAASMVTVGSFNARLETSLGGVTAHLG